MEASWLKGTWRHAGETMGGPRCNGATTLSELHFNKVVFNLQKNILKLELAQGI